MYVCIHNPKCCSLPVPPHPFASEKATPLPGISPTLVYQVSAGLGISSPTEARQGSCLLHMCPWTSNQPVYALWLVAQSLGVLRSSD